MSSAFSSSLTYDASNAFVVQAGDCFLGPKQFWDAKTGRAVRYADVLQDNPPLNISEKYMTGASSNGRIFLANPRPLSPNPSPFDPVEYYALDPVE